MVLKPLGTVLSITSANTVNNATLVYVQNVTGAPVLVTTANSTLSTSSLYVLGNSAILYKKAPSDTIQGTGVSATQVAFAN